MKRLLISIAVLTIGLTVSAQTDDINAVCDCPSYLLEALNPNHGNAQVKDAAATTVTATTASTTTAATAATAAAATAAAITAATAEQPSGTESDAKKLMAAETLKNAVRKWYIGANVGAQVFTGTTDKYLPFGQAIAPVGGFSFGRYINNWLNVDINLTAAQFKGLYARPVGDKHFVSDKVFDLDKQQYYQNGAYLQLYARAGFDFSTIIGGYEPTRRASFVPYVGLGMASGVGKNCSGFSNFGIVPSLDYGLEFLYKISPRWTAVADLHGNGLGIKLDNEDCKVHTFHASYGLKLGARFNLGN